MKPILIAKNIVKKYSFPEEQEILKNISFFVEKGEIISIYGASGSGKSTLLHIISTLDTSYEGELNILGYDLKEEKPSFLTSFRNENIGFVYQFHHLLTDFNVLQNVMLPALKLNKKNKKEIKEDVIELLKEVGLEAKMHYKVTKLSGGEQQRVAIARALINDPEIIFADEPTGNLDEMNSQLIFNILKNSCKRRGATVILISHDSTIYTKTDRSFVMTNGVLRLNK